MCMGGGGVVACSWGMASTVPSYFSYIQLRKLTISLLKFDFFRFNLSQNPMVPFCQQDPCQQISNNKIYHIANPPPPKKKNSEKE